jgi:repressor LexA
MEEKGMKQAELARLVGVGRSTINKYLRSSDKTHDALTVLKIAKALDVNSEWLYGATDIRKPFYEPSIVDIYGQLSEAGKKELYSYASYLLNKEKESVKELPHLGLTAAGAGVSGCDPFYETFKLRNVPKGADHILTVKGDSMEPLIKDGDIIFVAKTPIVENGEIAIVNMDGEITCKKFYMKNGVIELRSINPKYPPLYPDPAKFSIMGRVLLGGNGHENGSL